jgi:N-acetylated-alpha-linked acidic dipeptidase
MASAPKDQKDILDRNTLKLDALGSGSDYSSYIDHLGISALNIGFGGEDQGGEYHSIYDSYDMYRRFKDPKFEYGVALAKVGGRITMRLANADVLPFNFKDFYTTVNDYTNDLVKQADDMRAQTEVTDELISSKFFMYASDPTKTYLPPKSKDPVPYIDFSPLQNALATLKQSVDRFDTLRKANPFPNTNVDRLNQLMYESERALLLPDGLPNRPWYKHAIYAPGFYTGYGVKTLPGIREAMEQRKWDVMRQQMNEVSKAIDAYAQQIDAASNVLMMR